MGKLQTETVMLVFDALWFYKAARDGFPNEGWEKVRDRAVNEYFVRKGAEDDKRFLDRMAIGARMGDLLKKLASQ